MITHLVLAGGMGALPTGEGMSPAAASDAGVHREHPFLICRRAEFPSLRARAEREPWREMMRGALRRVAEGPPAKAEAVVVQTYLGACALAYILDEDNPRQQAERIRDGITKGLAAVVFNPSLDHAGTVPPLGAAFVAILALDIAWNDLTAEEIGICERVIEHQLAKISRKGAWPGARLGTFGTWDIYRGVRTGPDDAYFDDFLKQMTRDGVSTVSPAYAFARLGAGNDRPQKSAYADVLEFTGLDRWYYSHPRIQAFYRWLFSAPLTPAREFFLFGDVAPMWQPPNSPLLWRVGRFDRQAAAHAAWALAGKTPPGHVLSYVLMTEPLPEPVVPSSQIFPSGGAFFREPEDSPMGLGAVLYNIVENDEWHTHEEVNGLSLAGYGNRLLVHGGWLGDQTRPPWMNNTLALNRKRHARRTGAGITDGLLAEGFDYACGDSGQALVGGRFERSLFFIHGRPGVGGYFATLDDVSASANDRVHLFLHPATETEVESLEAGSFYRYAVTHHARHPGVSVRVAFSQTPDGVVQERVPSGLLSRVPQAGYHYRLEAVFKTDSAGRCSVLTLFIPIPAKGQPPALRRLADSEIRGFHLRHATGVEDLLIESGGDREVSCQGFVFQGRAVIVRRAADVSETFSFVRKGTLFRDSQTRFSSSRPVSLLMRGGRGVVSVTEEGTLLTIRTAEAAEIRVEERVAEPLARGAGWIRIAVPVGRHRLAIIPKTSSSP